MREKSVITRTIEAAGGLYAPGHLGELAQIVDFALVDAVLEETGTRERRLRLLPSRVVVYFVLALALFEDHSYQGVWAKLVAGLEGLTLTRPAVSSLSRARRRIGAAPLRHLFETPIQDACKAAGLVRPGGRGGTGRGTVSARRFRHTVGTQLAERGAKLHTIMKVLGHTSVSMALVYAQVSDQEVLRDYRAVLEPGATIAGPAAEELRTGALPDTSIDWLRTNFFKTELELGRCLRLPAEGPCECDLYLTCAKFVTTPEYAPRLRARREVEQTLARDAAERGWDHEVERHRCTSDRINKLLADLGEPAQSEEKAGDSSA